MPFLNQIIHNDEEGPYTQLAYLMSTQKGQYVSYGDRLFLATYNPELYFVEVDADTPEKRDPSGRWGKFKYLGDPDAGK